MKGEEPLLPVRIAYDEVANQYPLALSLLIEMHEANYGYVAPRRVVHRLMERYAAERFPDAPLDNPARSYVLKRVQTRYFSRLGLRDEVRVIGSVDT